MSENQQALGALTEITELTDKALSNIRDLTSRVNHLVDTIVGPEMTPEGECTGQDNQASSFSSGMNTRLTDIVTLTVVMNKSLDRLNPSC